MSIPWMIGTFAPNWSSLWTDQGIPLALMGIIVVFAALALVSLFITCLPRLMSWIERLTAKKPQPAAQPAAVSDPDQLPAELLVVIAAAVSEVISKPSRIIRARELRAEDMSWSMEGRMQQHSHVLRRERR